MEVYYRGERMAFTELKEPLRKVVEPVRVNPTAMVIRKPKKDHPWRQGWQKMKPWSTHPASTAPQPKKGTFLLS